jgi:hypothetical protein
MHFWKLDAKFRHFEPEPAGQIVVPSFLGPKIVKSSVILKGDFGIFVSGL